MMERRPEIKNKTSKYIAHSLNLKHSEFNQLSIAQDLGDA